MKTIAILELAFLFLAACENPVENQPAAPGPIAASALVFSHQFNVSEGVTNDCTGEAFIAQGNEVVLFTGTSDQAGGFHGTLHLAFTNFRFTNTVTGETLHINGPTNIQQQVTAGAMVTTAEGIFVLAGPGGQAVTNEVLHFVFQFVVNAKGTVTVENFVLRLSCT
jgi:hypothetical protein